MQYGKATHSEKRQKFFQLQRSAMAPVGMVAVVSMKTIMKKNRAITPTSSTPCRKNPFVPKRPYVNAPLPLESGPIPMPLLSTDVPGPSDEYHPGPTSPLYQLPQP